MDNIYKNLYFDTDTGEYVFMNGNDKRQVVSQESYLLIYLIEIMQKGLSIPKLNSTPPRLS